MFKVRSFMTAAFVLAALFGQSFAKDDRWFFTANEIADAYRYQQQFGARLRNPLEAQTCFEGKKDFAASYQRKRFVAPCRFVGETIRQLRELLESARQSIFSRWMSMPPTWLCRRRYMQVNTNNSQERKFCPRCSVNRPW